MTAVRSNYNIEIEKEFTRKAKEQLPERLMAFGRECEKIVLKTLSL